MSDKLKKFIEVNKKAFETAEPDPQLLNKLQKALTGKTTSRKKKWSFLRWAAAIAGPLLLATTLYFIFQKKNPDDGLVATEPIYEETSDYGDPVYAKQIDHFKEIIGLQQKELKQLKKEYPQLYNQFVGDITQLDSSYQSLKIQLAENPNREMLLEAMIQNLHLQSDLLNRQLLIIKEIKQKSKSHKMSVKNLRAT